jgi:penicillin amidase
VLVPANDQRLRHAVEHLAVWDCRMEPDRVAASIFNLFFTKWSERVAAERFSGETAGLIAGAIGGLAAELLADDRAGWFREKESREPAIIQSFDAALDFLAERFGPDTINWGWGRLHSLQQKHILSGRGELAQLLDLGGMPVRGDGVTVCNTGFAPDYSAPMGAGYRLIADLSDPHGGLWAVDAGSESGQPASPHYNDQIGDWLTGRYHYVPLDPEQLLTSADRELKLVPGA